MIRKALSLLLSLCMLAVLAGCGGDVQPESSLPAPDAAAPTPTPEPTPRPSESGLVLAVVYPDETVDALLELCASRGIEMTVREYGSIGELLADAAGGFPPDMFFLPALGEYAGRIAALCRDLSPYLEASNPLIPGLGEALSSDGTLPYLAYDFTLDCFAMSPSADIASVSGAQGAADARGVSLFPAYWSRDVLTSFALPYLQAEYGGDSPGFDSESFTALLGAIAAQPEEAGEGQSLLEYMPLSPAPGMLAALDGADSPALCGLPGEGSGGGLYVVEHCFGILESCEDPDSAWEILSVLLESEAQGLAGQFPAAQEAFAARLEDMVSDGSASAQAAELVRALVSNTTRLYAAEDYCGELIRAAVTAAASGNMTAAEAAEDIQRQALDHLTGG